eukprot:1522135-Alexandrium_andersonii.AAC.1
MPFGIVPALRTARRAHPKLTTPMNDRRNTCLQGHRRLASRRARHFETTRTRAKRVGNLCHHYRFSTAGA